MSFKRIETIRKAPRWFAVVSLAATLGAFGACGGDEENDDNGGTGNRSQGSACSSDSECGTGLICVPSATQSLEEKDLEGCHGCLAFCEDHECIARCLGSATCREVDCHAECGFDPACVADCQDMLAGRGGFGGGDIPWEDATPGMCTNTCDFADDGECDDRRPGSETDFCDPGTDCNDCGAVPGGDTPQPDPPTCEEFCAELPAESQAACIADCNGVIGATTCEEFCGAFPEGFQAGCLADCEAGATPIGGGTGSDGGGGNTATGTCQPDPNAGGGGGADAGRGADTRPTCDDSDVEGNACAEAEDCEVQCDCGVSSGQCAAGVCGSAADACAAGCDVMDETFNGAWCR